MKLKLLSWFGIMFFGFMVTSCSRVGFFGLIMIPKVEPQIPPRSADELMTTCNSLLVNALNMQDSVLTIKEFWYTITVHAGGGSSRINEPWKRSLSELINLFETNKGATLCGGHSDGLVALYNYYGLRPIQLTTDFPKALMNSLEMQLLL